MIAEMYPLIPHFPLACHTLYLFHVLVVNLYTSKIALVESPFLFGSPYNTHFAHPLLGDTTVVLGEMPISEGIFHGVRSHARTPKIIQVI